MHRRLRSSARECPIGVASFPFNRTFGDGERVLSDLIANEELAAKNKLPICQDTGMALVFLEIGQDVHIDGSIKDAVNEGVRQGYRDGHLRKSVVGDPLRRTNTGDNTPAVISFDLVAGDRVRIDVMPKGFGSENMSQSRMLKPADGVKGVKNFVIDVVEKAGSIHVRRSLSVWASAGHLIRRLLLRKRLCCVLWMMNTRTRSMQILSANC